MKSFQNEELRRSGRAGSGWVGLGRAGSGWVGVVPGGDRLAGWLAT